MKKLFLLLFSLISFSAFSQSNAELVGTWKMDNDKSHNKAYKDNSVLGDKYIILKSDGTYEKYAEFDGQKSWVGEGTFSATKHTLTLDGSYGRKMTIILYSGAALTVENQGVMCMKCYDVYRRQ